MCEYPAAWGNTVTLSIFRRMIFYIMPGKGHDMMQ